MDSALELSPSLIVPSLFSASARSAASAASTLFDFFALGNLGIFKFMIGKFEKCKGDDAYLLQLG